ncbi:unnamed protein product [Phytophthora lilii]|uniref:Unnamed protein product n=1 Tax=Phytophthora lilii TaxID=2077276 RepID=A0A9W6TIB2_9STRA|nr:unnamed protein product [Phytophthora lilii]
MIFTGFLPNSSAPVDWTPLDVRPIRFDGRADEFARLGKTGVPFIKATGRELDINDYDWRKTARVLRALHRAHFRERAAASRMRNRALAHEEAVIQQVREAAAAASQAAPLMMEAAPLEEVAANEPDYEFDAPSPRDDPPPPATPPRNPHARAESSTSPMPSAKAEPATEKGQLD